MTDLERELQSFADADVSSSVVEIDSVYGRARQRTVRRRVALGGGAVGLGIAAVTAVSLLTGSSATIETVPPATTTTSPTSASPSGSASQPATSSTPRQSVNPATAAPVVGGLLNGIYCGDITEVGVQDASLTLAPVTYRKTSSDAAAAQDSARHELGLTNDFKVETPTADGTGLQDVVPIVGTRQALQLVGSSGEKFEVVVTGDKASRITQVGDINISGGCPLGAPQATGPTAPTPPARTSAPAGTSSSPQADGEYCGTVTAASASSLTLRAWTSFTPGSGVAVSKLDGTAKVFPVSATADVIRGYAPTYDMRSEIIDAGKTLAEAMTSLVTAPDEAFRVVVEQGKLTLVSGGQSEGTSFFHGCSLDPGNL